MNDLIDVKSRNTMKAVDVLMENTNDHQKGILLDLLESLIAIRNSPVSNKEKIKKTLGLFKQSRSFLPLLQSLKPILWDNRSPWVKLGVGATITTAMLFPGNAGIAALGTAIGVPLWVVVGGGYTFSVLCAEKLRSVLKRPAKEDIQDAVYKVINE